MTGAGSDTVPAELRCATPWPLLGLLGGGAVLCALVAAGVVAGTDPPGRLLAGLAGACLALMALRDAGLRPTLLADAAGVTVVAGLRRQRLAWAELAPVRTERATRRLVRARWLELETPDTLVTVSALRLGRPVDDVAVELEACRLTRVGLVS